VAEARDVAEHCHRGRGRSGAPVLGWAAVTNASTRMRCCVSHHFRVDAAALLALAIARRDEYAHAAFRCCR